MNSYLRQNIRILAPHSLFLMIVIYLLSIAQICLGSQQVVTDTTRILPDNSESYEGGSQRKVEDDSTKLIMSYYQAARERQVAKLEEFRKKEWPQEDTTPILRAVSDIKIAQTGSAFNDGTRSFAATTSNGGFMWIDYCCPPPTPIEFTITQANTEVMLFMDFEQNLEWEYFKVKIETLSGRPVYYIASYDLDHCRTTGYNYYRYNCTDMVTLDPGVYRISLIHTAYNAGYPGYYYYGTLEFYVNQPIVGDNMSDPIIAGTFSSDFQYSDTQNTNNFKNTYTGQPTNDVFYRFTLTKPMEVTMSHCGSGVSDTYLHLLDASGNRIAYNNDYSGTGCCSNTMHSYLQLELTSGTYYIVSEGYSQNGNIKTNIIGLYNEFNYPEIPGSYSTEPEAVGEVSGSLEVSGTGAAIYSVPIAVPLGVGGLQPSVSLTYNSQSGNGVAGWGVNISGGSVITRGAKSIYYDDIASGVTFLGNDAFYIDGQRLIYLSGTPGAEGAIYHPESDPFTVVTAHGTYNGTSCNTWFEVIKNGIKYYYGSTATARQLLPGGRINAWYLDYVEDPLGNYMNYSYNTSDYFVYLNSITYGKNKNETTSLENRVLFNYGSRPDYMYFVIGGTKVTLKNRLSRITTYTGNTVFREYVMDYSQPDHYSRLAAITEKNSSGEALKPTMLTWAPLPSFSQYGRTTAVSDADVFPSVAFADQSFQAADLNGDGIADLVGVFPIRIPIGPSLWTERVYAYIYWGSLDTYGNPQFLTGDSYDLGELSSINLKHWEEQKGSCTPIDFNGDGIFELLMPHLNITQHWKYVQFRFFNGPFSNQAFVYHLQQSSEMPAYATGDLNNDGKGDVVYIEKGHSGNNYFPGEIVGFYQDTTLYRAQISLNLPSKPQKIFVNDFNGDGLNDVMVFYSGGYTIFWNQGQGITNQTLSNDKKAVGTNISDCKMIRVGDFNGDGLVDFLMNATDSNKWYFALNNGNGTFTKQLACTLELFHQLFTILDDDKFSCFVYDMDLDGKDDVVIIKAMYDIKIINNIIWGKFRKTHACWMRSTGTTLTQLAAVTSNNEDDAFSKYFVTGDFNGDGKIELMSYSKFNCYNGTTASSKTWRTFSNTYLIPGSGMIGYITNGPGNYSNITYASLAADGIYTKGSGSSYPVVDLTLPLTAVKTVVSDNGVAGTIKVNYTYAGAKAHLQGKGFLGLTSQTASNTTTGVVTESGITALNTTFFVPSKTYTKITVDNKTAETIVNYTLVNKGLKKYFSYPNAKTEKDLDGNITTTTYTFNESLGYITEEKTEYGSSSMYSTMQYGNYILAGGAYKPQLLTLIRKHADDSQAFTQKTAFIFNSSRGYPVSQVENYGTPLALTTEFTGYDNFGNCTSYRISGAGLTTLTYYNEYDATKRFVTKSYSSPATVVTTFTYDTWGKVLTETDATNPANLLTTTHTYNGWNRKTSSTMPDGKKVTYHSGWNTNSSPKRYFTLVQGRSQPWVKTWYDRVGRETSVETIGPKGKTISKTNTYNNKGQLTQTETRQGDLTITENFNYDGRGRISSQLSSTGSSLTYNYGIRSMSVNSNGRSYTKTFDAWGNIVTSSDPVSSVSYSYHSSGNPKSSTSAGATLTMSYDAAGNQVTMNDPNAGQYTYTYDPLGRVKTQTDAKGNVHTNYYDDLNRLSYSKVGSIRTDYSYGTSGYELNRVTQIKTGNNYVSYLYDKYGRIKDERRFVDGEGLHEISYVYDNNGNLQKKIYPGSLETSYEYDAYGNMIRAMAGSQQLWALTASTGTITTTTVGGTMTATRTHNSQGLLTNLKTIKGSAVLRNMTFNFDGATGNLMTRTGMISQAEIFEYDNLDRLKKVKHGATEVMSMDYNANGNITSKTGLGNYLYAEDNAGPHALTRVQNSSGLINTRGQLIEYNPFNKATLLRDTVGTDAYNLDITYGPDQQRWKTVLKKNNAVNRTTLFLGDYEKITESGVTRHLYYLPGPALYVKQSGQTDKIYYLHSDHLGSVISITDGAGSEVFRAAYDAWGRQTVTNNTIKFYRGYTGHEHLPEFGLINMNGRMYDPTVGRFLGADPYVQLPDYSQNFNRYSYCLNNPLVYTDPDGEIIIPILIGAGVSVITNGINNVVYDQPFFQGAGQAALIGAVSGAFSFGIGEVAQVMTGLFGKIAFQTLAHGHVNGVMSVFGGGSYGSGFISGAFGSLAATGTGILLQNSSSAIQAIGTVAGGALTGGIGSEIAGGDFWDGFRSGAISAGLNHALHELMAQQEDDEPGREYARHRLKSKDATIDEKIYQALYLARGKDIDFWIKENGYKYIDPIVEANPVVGIPNDVSILFTGEDLVGNPATTGRRVVAGASILTFGVASGLFNVSSAVMTYATRAHLITTVYSIWKNYNFNGR